MDLLRIVVKKRSETVNTTGAKDRESLTRFSTRVAKLRGEGPMASSLEPEVTLEVVSININDIEVPPNYVRENLGDLTPLIASIKIYGIQQPLKVVKIKGSKKFRLVFGRRRLAAAEQAGFDAVPCIVELVTREDRLQMLSLVENLHRNDVNPFEQAISLKNLQKANISAQDLSQNLSIAPEILKDILGLLDLPEAIRAGVMEKPEQFSLAMLKLLCQTYRQSKDNGQKLFEAILAGDITSDKEAKQFLGKI